MSKKFVRKWGKGRSTDLIDIMGKVSDDLSSNFEAKSEDARKILKEAHAQTKKKEGLG